jgi:hypothetical protein
MPPFRFKTAKAADGGTVMFPELTTTMSPAAGTVAGFQLAGLSQSLETAPVQVIVFAVTTKSPVMLSGEFIVTLKGLTLPVASPAQELNE